MKTNEPPGAARESSRLVQRAVLTRCTLGTTRHAAGVVFLNEPQSGQRAVLARAHATRSDAPRQVLVLLWYSGTPLLVLGLRLWIFGTL